ncbi:MAG: TolC family protein [Paludibacteraceae bacterium]|nr:TolC family protein [Bacteroidales bacterium]MDY4512475.1 TolC family protein [Paludibacteraceae bacterium]MDY6036743.1 TolC family protein [Paludibacteraceae bacterium]
MLTIALTALCTGMFAQEPANGTAGTLSLSLVEAQEYAVANNKSLQNASLEVKKAYAQRWQTIAAMLPQVDGTAQFTTMFDYQMDMKGMKIAMPANITHTVTASIGLNGQAIMGALLNNLAIEMQDITRAQSESEIRANVMSSYLTVLVMEDIVALLDSSLTNIEHLAAMTQRSVDVGAAEQTAADQIVVKANALKNSINSNKRNVELARNSLKVLLGVGVDTDLRLTQTLDELLSASSALDLLSQNFDINNNYNYQLLVKNTELAKKNVTMAGLAYTPTVSAYYQYTAKKYFSDESTLNMSAPHMAGVSVSIPIWSSGKRAAGVREKKIAYQEAVNTLNETTDNLGIQNQQLRFNLSNAYETYMNERDNIEVTKRVFRNTTNKFEHGVASSLELTNASNDLISAQSSYVQAVMSLVNAQVELAKFLNNN